MGTEKDRSVCRPAPGPEFTAILHYRDLQISANVHNLQLGIDPEKDQFVLEKGEQMTYFQDLTQVKVVLSYLSQLGESNV